MLGVTAGSGAAPPPAGFVPLGVLGPPPGGGGSIELSSPRASAISSSGVAASVMGTNGGALTRGSNAEHSVVNLPNFELVRWFANCVDCTHPSLRPVKTGDTRYG